MMVLLDAVVRIVLVLVILAFVIGTVAILTTRDNRD